MKPFIRVVGLAVLLMLASLIAHPQAANTEPAVYADGWTKVDSLFNRGLPRSAKPLIDSLHARARREDNGVQSVKATIYRLRFALYVEEDETVKARTIIEKELQQSNTPARALLHSLAAELYWSYYQDNRWRFANRSTTENPDPDDIRTWDLRRVVEEVVHHFSASLRDRKTLEKINALEFAPLLKTGEDSRELRPTLYDFLAWRALDFFANREAAITRPADQFDVNDARYFADGRAFTRLPIATTDTLSFLWRSVRTLQQLLESQLSRRAREAAIHTDLRRLVFIHEETILPQKDSLFEHSLQSLLKRHERTPVSAEIRYTLAELYNTIGDRYNPLVSDSLRWHKVKALELCMEAIRRFPGTYGARACAALKDRITRPSLSLTAASAISPGENAPFKASWRNIDTLYCRIVKADPDHPFEQRRQHPDSLLMQLFERSPVHEWIVSLPPEQDFQPHAAEAIMPPLPKGHYALIASTTPELDLDNGAAALVGIQATSLAALSRNRNGELLLVDRATGAPLEGVPARIWLHSRSDQDPRKGKKLTTNAQGIVRVSHYDRARVAVAFMRDDDTLWTHPGYVGHHNEQKDRSHRRALLFTDRTIYRPGQRVYFKGIVFKSHTIEGSRNRVVKGAKGTIVLIGANYQRMDSLQIRTGAFGTFHGSFELPAGGLTGRYQIRSDWGGTNISVEEYKRPKFTVGISAPDSSMRVHDTVTIRGNATALAGFAIDGAQVTYRVVRKTWYPYPWLSWWLPPGSETVEILNGTTRTGEDGSYAVRFPALPDPKTSAATKPAFNYTVSVDVTDINGETRQAESTVTVGYTAMKIDLAIPEKVDRDAGPLAFSLATRNLSGESVDASGTVTIYPLQTPERILRERHWEPADVQLVDRDTWRRRLPHDPYGREDRREHWARGDAAVTLPFNTADTTGYRLPAGESLPPGTYRAEARSTDRFGERVEARAFFTVYGSEAETVPRPVIDWVVEPAAQASPGDTLWFIAGTADSSLHVLFERTRKTERIERRWIRLGNGQKRIPIVVTEEDRGGISVSLTLVRYNRSTTHHHQISVPWANRQLDISLSSFRDKLEPGQKEEWRLSIKGPDKDAAAAEMVAVLYDAALDQFRKHSWPTVRFPAFRFRGGWSDRSLGTASQRSARGWHRWPRPHPLVRSYDRLDPSMVPFSGPGRSGVPGIGYGAGISDVVAYGRGLGAGSRKIEILRRGSSSRTGSAAAPTAGGVPPGADEVSDLVGHLKGGSINSLTLKKRGALKMEAKPLPVTPRTNLAETAFWLPELRTDPEGNIVLRFTAPDALTRWRFMGFAHTPDLSSGFIDSALVTQKRLMVTPNLPRYFRENDTIQISAKITSLADTALAGMARLELFDAATMTPVDTALSGLRIERPFSVDPKRSTTVTWRLSIPQKFDALAVRTSAATSTVGDGEETALPVLRNRMLVTESMPLPVGPHQKKSFTFDKLLHADSSTTLSHHRLTLEYTSNPAWYAVQALPYLMEYPHDCMEQIFSRFYANTIAAHVITSNPAIEAIYREWESDTSGRSLVSRLEKNEELKQLVLRETPWVLEARSQSERMARLSRLFDRRRLRREQNRAIRRLERGMLESGAWPWFSGMHPNRYITRHIATGFARLMALGMLDGRQKSTVERLVSSAMSFLEGEIAEDYRRLRESDRDLDSNNLTAGQIQFCYLRSWYPQMSWSSKEAQDAWSYYRTQARKYWLSFDRSLQGMIALALHRTGDSETARSIVQSIQEHALWSDELGMYWKENRGYRWYQAPIESHALMVELFSEVTGNDTAVDGCRTWLLKNKQTSDWGTTKATADACYALLLGGAGWLSTTETASVTLGTRRVDPGVSPHSTPEAGTGYFKRYWPGDSIAPSMARVTVENPNRIVSWGALYWQYFERMDRITTHATPLRLEKALFVERPSPTGPKLHPLTEKATVRVGERIIVRIELRVDRAMEFVHMKDRRAAGFEPENVFSGRRRQDGLGYYESTRDASTDFFFDYLPKGTYVFEYPVRVSHRGDFSNGITTIQCMYAPEFAGHSEGVRVRVE